MSAALPTRLEAKAAARRLRAGLVERGIRIGHAEALESMARWPEGYPNASTNEQLHWIAATKYASDTTPV